MKRFTVVVVLIALLGVAGCGGSESTGNPDEDQIRETMSSFSDAIARQDYERACGMYVQDSIDFFEAQGHIPDGCVGVMKASYGALTNDQLDKLGKVESASVNGDTATVELENGDTARFEKADDEWKLSLD